MEIALKNIQSFINRKKSWIQRLNALVFLILIMGIVVLRVQNLSLKKDIQRRQQDAIVRKNTINSFRNLQLESQLTGRKIDFPALQPISGKETAKNILPTSDYSIVILFTHFDCGMCLDYELRLWNSFRKDFPLKNKVEVVGVANTKRTDEIYRRTRAVVTFPVFQDSKGGESLFKTLDIKRGPFVLLVDTQKQQIIYAHFAEVDKKEKSHRFVEKVKGFLL